MQLLAKRCGWLVSLAMRRERLEMVVPENRTSVRKSGTAALLNDAVNLDFRVFDVGTGLATP